ncbi:uncharacterized protein N7482_010303 [Penicillium canariense]|uniref:Uncharacterized protein n=1 Tax=Penicillium canariense TaxID=189055 RepID=A0A9W9HMA2_9EURO|nr:uncharacterized protein N7482_010303 [Penicillium canariense]KAJ5151051.1 hypothetical protein N7482_010303 [Penicillium canariense]
MLNASSTDSLAQGSAFSRSQLTHTDSALPRIVAITSVVTETVHPTYVFTEVITETTETSMTSTIRPELETSSSEYVQPDTVQSSASQTQMAEPGTSTSSMTQSTILLPATTQSPSPSWTSSLMTPSTQPMDDLTISHSPYTERPEPMLPFSGHPTADAQTNPWDPLPVGSSLASSPLPSSTFSSTTLSTAILSTTSIQTTTSSTQTSSSTLTPSSLPQIVTAPIPSSLSSASSPLSSTSSSSPSSSSIAGIISGSVYSEGPANQNKSFSHHVGAIVGGTVGGTAFIALGLLACFLFFRRRRRRCTVHRQGSPGKRLLRTSDSMSSIRGLHGRQFSQPSFPIARTTIPSAPIFPASRNSMPPGPRPNPTMAASNQDLSLDRMYPRSREQHDTFADPEDGLVSPIIQLHPPSCTVSNYSPHSSCEGGLEFVKGDDYDSSARTSRYESIYYPDESTITLPFPHPRTNWLSPHCHDNSKTRLSTRSDPFDLETPLKALHEWPPLPPRPTARGDNF